MQLKTDAQEEALKITKLEEELSKERHAVRSLQMQLQREKNVSEEDKLKDTELISQLRIKLDEALEVKDRLVMEQKNIELMHAMKDLDKDNSTGKNIIDSNIYSLKLLNEISLSFIFNLNILYICFKSIKYLKY
jgi:hypothetical protein